MHYIFIVSIKGIFAVDYLSTFLFQDFFVKIVNKVHLKNGDNAYLFIFKYFSDSTLI